MPDSDRQMFIKALLDLKQEVDHLKARLDVVQSAAHPVQAIKPVSEPEEAEWQGQGVPVTSGEIGKVVDIKAEEPEEQDLSLRNTELENIRKALEKHHGNRKLAAQEVGVSERTLYRKIKEYHI